MKINPLFLWFLPVMLCCGLICAAGVFVGNGCTPTPTPIIAPSDTVYVSLPPQVITVTENKVQWRTKTEVKTVYVPTEGSVSFDSERYGRVIATRDSLLSLLSAKPVADSTAHTPIDRDWLLARLAFVDSILAHPRDFGLISVQTRGFCLRPLAGAGYNGKLDAFAGIKIAYWNRYGVALGLTTRQIGAGITRKLDFIPYTHNTEAIVFYGYPLRKEVGSAFAGIVVGL